ncbi:BTAD domain-containing putative transcriptional regulator [Spirillospora sp. NPDC047279]|uniref:AfsR/SARP family transcriptional regulator n=1 Tax=Spirillospora sp. NPDC047279 TaxID=3155478 RepID=UPI0033C0B3DD
MDIRSEGAQGLRFAVLGPVRAWAGGAEAALGGPQQRALLAVLLLNGGRAVPIDHLVDTLWGNEPPARAVGTLRTYVSRLRLALERDRTRPEFLVSAGDGYALRVPAHHLDAAVFEDLAAQARDARERGDLARARELLGRALDRWDGATALAGLPGPFAAAQRARLAERRLAVLEARIEADLAAGGHAEIVGELAVLTADHPLRESLRALQMLALYRCGRQAEALEVYAEARRLLAGELGIEPGAELRETHERVLRAEAEAEPAPSPAVAPPPVPAPPAPVPPAPAPPAALPADLADFTGRAAAIERLTSLLTVAERTAPAIAAVSGIGGVGKTALAVHVGHAVRASYPGGQLYVDLHGAGAHPAEPAAVLGEFLRALGVPGAAVPETEGERAALYRTRLAGARVLIVLDNARDAAQIRPLLPGSPGCAVLVTSRARPTGVPGLRLVDLDVPDPAEAAALFAAVAGPGRVAGEARAVRRAVTLCGHLPLAVRIAAARLAARPGWTVAGLAARLEDERRRLPELRLGDLDVEATFRLGYDQLDAGQARAFRLLALPETGSFAPAAAAALLGVDRWTADDLLETLVDLGLLDSPAAGRYRFHDLLWLFARQVSGEDDPAAERRAALTRLLGHLTLTQCRVLRAVRPGTLAHDAGDHDEDDPGGPGFATMAEARAWTAAELSGLLTVVRQVAEDPDGPLAAAADLLLAMDPLLEDGYRWAEVEPAARAVLAEATRRGDVRAEARARHAFGRLLTHTSRLDEAHDHAERVLVLCLETDDRVLLAAAHDLLAHIALYRRDPRRAVEHTELALALGRELGDRAGEIERTANLAYLRVDLGDAEGAAASAERGRALARETGYATGEAYALYVLGIALRELGRLDEAVARFDDALAICWSQGLRARESYVLLRIAETQLERGRPHEAVACAEKSLAIGRELGEEYQQGRALVALGHALHARDSAPDGARASMPDGVRASMPDGVRDSVPDGARDPAADGARECWKAALELFAALGVGEADDVRALLDGVTTSRGP